MSLEQVTTIASAVLTIIASVFGGLFAKVKGKADKLEVIVLRAGIFLNNVNATLADNKITVAEAEEIKNQIVALKVEIEKLLN